MKTVTIKPSAGNYLPNICRITARMAKRQHCRVRFDFNNVPMEATPKKSPVTMEWEFEKILGERHEAYRLSRKGQEAAIVRRGQITGRQKIIDTLTNDAVLAVACQRGLDDVISIIRGLAEHGDDVDVRLDHKKVINALESAGYKEDEHVGHEPQWFNTRDRLGRYIVGQAIACLRMGMPPHPVTLRFCAEYEQLPKEV